jgi:hypothetical protein
MDHRTRFALCTGPAEDKLCGHVEADETFIGGKARNMHKDMKARKVTGAGGKGKTMVPGILQRGGKVRTKVVDNLATPLETIITPHSVKMESA